jgi:hypothetical protein
MAANQSNTAALGHLRPECHALQYQGVTSTRRHVDELLRFPDTHPYRKFWGTHWRLVELADLEVEISPDRLVAGMDQEVAWLTSTLGDPADLSVDRRPRRHASMEGNAVYAFSRLGFAHHPSTRRLAEALIRWQWPDGGWNCDGRRTARRSSFHESVTPAIGLATYAHHTGDPAALAAAVRTAELLLQHRLFRHHGTGEPIHPSWTKLHYPPYWHYDVLQGLRLLRAVDRLDDHRASDALDLLERARHRDGTFSGPQWSSKQQPAVLDRDTYSQVLTRRAQEILEASGRSR